MTIDDITPSQIDALLRRLSDKWSPISFEFNSPDGMALYYMVRRGLAEAVSRFIAWSPDCNFEIWFDGTITGRWTQLTVPSLVKDLFPQGLPISAYQHSYSAARLSSPLTLRVPEGEPLKKICAGEPFALTGDLVKQLLPIDRTIVFAESYKRIPRIALFYSRATFAERTREPIPIDSYFFMELVQGACPSGGITARNVAEVEPLEGIQVHFPTSSAISFAFAQACFACSQAMFELLEMGRKGEISEIGERIDRRLGDACARLYHAGRYVIAMYQRHGRDPSYVAAMVANPLSIRNVDHGLLREVDAIAVLDSTLGAAPPSVPNPNSTAARDITTNADQLEEKPAVDAEYTEILQMIRHMGRAFETTPDTYGKFSEEELRDHILTYLGGRFHGGTSAEQFRKHGRTDLCITFPNSEAFVSECKIWGGPSECSQAIDQLMSYLTSRDRVGALVFFNKSVKDFTKNVIQASAEVIRANKLYLAQLPMSDFGEHHFEVCHKNDSYRRYQLYVFLFNLYPNPRETSQKKSIKNQEDKSLGA